MMLRADPRPWARRATTRTLIWWRAGPTRLRLRRHLVALSVGPALLLLVLIAKLLSVQIVGYSMIGDFSHHDNEALRDDIDTLSLLDVIEPQKVTFAQGDLAVLEGRLDDAEHAFDSAMAHSVAGDTCTARVNLEMVRETLGDLAARSGDKAKARQRYTSALGVVTAAPASAHCFTGNDDPNPDRRRIRDATAQRLNDKLKSLDRPPGAPPAPPPTAAPTDPSAPLTPSTLPPPPAPAGPPTPEAPTPPPPPPAEGGPTPVFGPGAAGGPGGTGALNDADPDRLPSQGGGANPGHALGGGGDPLDKLRDALGTSDSTGASRE
jgi:hypothetical protein